MKQPLTIWILGDGKPGHENQSLGLTEAIGRRVACMVHRVPARPWRMAFGMAAHLPKPDVIVAAGHSTHGLLWCMSKWYKARSVVIMRPSLPLGIFDLVIAPHHDFKNPPSSGGRVLTTRGALNRVTPHAAPPRAGSLVLLGGPSKHHGWDSEAMRAMLKTIALHTPELEATDSRRTPDGFFASLDFIARRYSHVQTPQGWLSDRLSHSAEVWVTEDSVSMIYEALTSGARVGVLPVPRIRANARVIQGVDQLVAEGRLTSYENWNQTGILKPSTDILAESDRASEWLLQQLASA